MSFYLLLNLLFSVKFALVLWYLSSLLLSPVSVLFFHPCFLK